MNNASHVGPASNRTIPAIIHLLAQWCKRCTNLALLLLDFVFLFTYSFLKLLFRFLCGNLQVAVRFGLMGFCTSQVIGWEDHL